MREKEPQFKETIMETMDAMVDLLMLVSVMLNVTKWYWYHSASFPDCGTQINHGALLVGYTRPNLMSITLGL